MSINGATGRNAAQVNGLYIASLLQHNDHTVFTKVGAAKEVCLWMRPDSRWGVSSTKTRQANKNVSWLSANEKGLSFPTDCTSWLGLGDDVKVKMFNKRTLDNVFLPVGNILCDPDFLALLRANSSPRSGSMEHKEELHVVQQLSPPPPPPPPPPPAVLGPGPAMPPLLSVRKRKLVKGVIRRR